MLVGDLIDPLLVLAGLILIFGLVIGGFVARRHLLARNAATFDCSLRRDLPRRSRGWMLGVARYESDRLEWFRIFTVNPRPAKVLMRSLLDTLEWRNPTQNEVDSILPDSVIVRCSYAHEVLELAMTKSDYTGFATWLESAPPGKQPFES